MGPKFLVSFTINFEFTGKTLTALKLTYLITYFFKSAKQLRIFLPLSKSEENLVLSFWPLDDLSTYGVFSEQIFRTLNGIYGQTQHYSN